MKRGITPKTESYIVVHQRTNHTADVVAFDLDSAVSIFLHHKQTNIPISPFLRWDISLASNKINWVVEIYAKRREVLVIKKKLMP